MCIGDVDSSPTATGMEVQLEEFTRKRRVSIFIVTKV
jgi:hypothetical protein